MTENTGDDEDGELDRRLLRRDAQALPVHRQADRLVHRAHQRRPEARARERLPGDVPEHPAADARPRCDDALNIVRSMAEHLLLFMDGIDTFYARFPTMPRAPVRPALRVGRGIVLRRRSATARPTSGAFASSAAAGRSSRPRTSGASSTASATWTTGGPTTASSRCRSSLHAPKITCIDSAILAYGLLELLFGDVKRRLLAIHRRDPVSGEECGHCVALYWNDAGKVGVVRQVQLSRASATATPSSTTRCAVAAELRQGLRQDGLPAALLRRHDARGGGARHRLAKLDGAI